MARTSIFVKIEEASTPPRATVTTRGETTRLHPEIVELEALRLAVQGWVDDLTRTAVADGKRVEVTRKVAVALRQVITQVVIQS